MKNLINGKRVLFFVTHQDDESLFFGGLLSEIRGKSLIKIVSMTEPFPGRPDTNTRKTSFEMVCWILNCERSIKSLPDFPTLRENTKEIVYEQFELARRLVGEEIDLFKPDVVFTHNFLGEPNIGYTSGHITHRLVSDSVVAECKSRKIKTFVDGIGLASFDYEVSYERCRKMALLNCYLPNWAPIQYTFAYDNEKYLEVK